MKMDFVALSNSFSPQQWPKLAIFLRWILWKNSLISNFEIFSLVTLVKILLVQWLLGCRQGEKTSLTMAKRTTFSQGLSWEKYIRFNCEQLFQSTASQLVIDNLHKNGKSYNISNYFFKEKHKILPQFDDLTSKIWIFYIDFTKLQIWYILANLQFSKICIKNPNLTCEVIKLGQNLVFVHEKIVKNIVALAIFV